MDLPCDGVGCASSASWRTERHVVSRSLVASQALLYLTQSQWQCIRTESSSLGPAAKTVRKHDEKCSAGCADRCSRAVTCSLAGNLINHTFVWWSNTNLSHLRNKAFNHMVYQWYVKSCFGLTPTSVTIPGPNTPLCSWLSWKNWEDSWFERSNGVHSYRSYR